MKLAPLVIAVALPLLLVLPAKGGERFLGSYQARLSSQDHYNSRGTRLTNAAGVIRQDRANFHKFGKRDAEDQYDTVFSDKKMRALMEQLLRDGRSTKEARRAIVDGSPLIQVKIYRRHIEVRVISD